MTMETIPPGHYARPPEAPQPTAEQLARLARRNRFNRLFVYLPVGLVALLWLGLVLGLLWLTIVGSWFAMDTNQEYYRALVSGVADAFTILMLSPLLVLCAIPIVLAAGLIVYRRRRKGDREPGPESLPIMWRIENVVSSVRSRVDGTTPKVAQPIINAYGAVTYLRTFYRRLKEIISQEIDRYVNNG